MISLGGFGGFLSLGASIPGEAKRRLSILSIPCLPTHNLTLA
jgi:hypothetical protein